MYKAKGSTKTFDSARNCAVSHFGTEAVIALGFDMWMDVATGRTVIIESAPK